jgi:peroxiredoxin (alkyl hydroperoxide reductase subunit C)
MLSQKWRQHENQYFEEATQNNKSTFILVPKRFYLYVQLNYMLFKPYLNLKRNTMVIGASCDTNEVHFAWLNTAKTMVELKVYLPYSC